MRIALVYQASASSWWRHPELYNKHSKRILDAGQILEQHGLRVSVWNSIKSYVEDRQNRKADNELVFSAVENCFERNRAGLIPSLWELLDIPYIGSDPYAFTVTTDKKLFQDICKSVGLSCPPYFEIFPETTTARIKSDLTASGFSFPLVLKYRYGTLSYGLSLVHNMDELISESERLTFSEPDSPILCQKYIAGREITVPIIGTGVSAQVLSVIEYTGSNQSPLALYDMQWKNELDDLVQIVPLPENSCVAKKIQEDCLRLYQYLGLRDMSRIDLRVTESGEIYFLEVNCLPNLGYESAFDPVSYGGTDSFDDIMLKIVHSAWDRNKRRMGTWNLKK